MAKKKQVKDFDKVYKVRNRVTGRYLAKNRYWNEQGEVFRDLTHLNRVLSQNMIQYNRFLKAGDNKSLKEHIAKRGEDSEANWDILEYNVVLADTRKLLTTREDKIDKFLDDENNK